MALFSRAPVDMVGLEGLDRDRGVAKIFEPHLVEIIAPDIDVEILGPIVLHPLVDDGAAGHEFLDPVGAVAERRLERGGADVALLAGCVGSLPPMLRQHAELTQDHRHFTVTRRIEDEGDLALAGLLDLHDVAIVGRLHRAVLLDHFHREDHVLDRDRLAIVVARVGAQAERRRREVGRMADRFGDQPILGRHFVERSDTIKVSEIIPAPTATDPFKPGHDLVEVVEGAECDHAHGAALRRVRIDVVEMLEPRRILELPEQRQAVPPIAVDTRRLGARRGAEERHAEPAEDGGARPQGAPVRTMDRRVRRKETSGETRSDYARFLGVMSDFCDGPALTCARSHHHILQ